MVAFQRADSSTAFKSQLSEAVLQDILSQLFLVSILMKFVLENETENWESTKSHFFLIYNFVV